MSSPEQDRPCARLKALRKRLGKSQEEMAVLLSLSTKGYQRYERGEREIPAITVDRAHEHLGVNPRWLMDNDGPMLLPMEDPLEALSPSIRLFRIPSTETERMKQAKERVRGVLADYPAIEKLQFVEVALTNVAAVEGIELEQLYLLANAFNLLAAGS